MPLFLFPLGDDNRDRQLTPYVNYVLLAINIAVFFLFQFGPGGDSFTMAFSTVPKEIVTGQDLITEPKTYKDPQTGEVVRDRRTGEPYQIPGLERTPIPVWFTLLTSMFMHGNLMHLLGNMLYLWIFGDNIEDEMGHVKYLAFYMLSGILASLTHVFMNAWGANAEVPSLGASGAIAGVLGAYLLMHPTRGVRVLVFRVIMTMPAWIVVGLWFVLQVLGGMGTAAEGGGGVAYSAHIGGFLFGMLLAPLFANVENPFTKFSRRGRGVSSHDHYSPPGSQWKDDDLW